MSPVFSRNRTQITKNFSKKLNALQKNQLIFYLSKHNITPVYLTLYKFNDIENREREGYVIWCTFKDKVYFFSRLY